MGATFEPAKGSHFTVRLNGKTSILPMHGKDLKKGALKGIKKGTLWLSLAGRQGWNPLATGIAYPFGLCILIS